MSLQINTQPVQFNSSIKSDTITSSIFYGTSGIDGHDLLTPTLAGAGGYIDLRGGDGFINDTDNNIMTGDGHGSDGGYINLRGGGGGQDGYTSGGGIIEMMGGGGGNGGAGAAGRIYGNAGEHEGNAGCINISGANSINGGSIDISANGGAGITIGTTEPTGVGYGHIWSQQGEDDSSLKFRSNNGDSADWITVYGRSDNGKEGSLNLNGNWNCSSPGNSLGGSIDLSAPGGDGGSGSGGSLCSRSCGDNFGGTLNMSAGIYLSGGSIDTSNGGGSINTSGGTKSTESGYYGNGGAGGCINLQGGGGYGYDGGSGGYINLLGGGGGDSSNGGGGPGGFIELNGADGSDGYGGSGGFIQANGNQHGGPAGYLKMNAGYDTPAGAIDTSAGVYDAACGGAGGSIITSGGNACEGMRGGAGGFIYLSGGSSNGGDHGGPGGSIIMLGGPATRAAGSINTSASNDYIGGSITTTGSYYYDGGSINTSGGGYINTSGNGVYSGGYINTSGNDVHSGGYINTSCGGGFIKTCGTDFGIGGYINTSSPDNQPGGYINTSSGSCGGDSPEAGAGGYINTSGSNSGLIEGGGGAGGFINTSGCFNIDGGSINTSGGGSINTSGFQTRKITISGAGTSAANGDYYSTDNGANYYNANSYRISVAAIDSNYSNAYLYDSSNILLYQALNVDDIFISGNWSLVEGDSPVFTSISNNSVVFKGGSINTTGSGYIQFGYDTFRTTLSGTATQNRTVLLPDKTGTVALTSDIPDWSNSFSFVNNIINWSTDAIIPSVDQQGTRVKTFKNTATVTSANLYDNAGIFFRINGSNVDGYATATGIIPGAHTYNGRGNYGDNIMTWTYPMITTWDVDFGQGIAGDYLPAPDSGFKAYFHFGAGAVEFLSGSLLNGKGINSPSKGYSFYINGNKMVGQVCNGTVLTSTTLSATILVRRINRLAAHFDGTNVNFYVNGTTLGSLAGPGGVESWDFGTVAASFINNGSLAPSDPSGNEMLLYKASHSFKVG